MKQYQTLAGGSFQSGNMCIPPDPANSDYQRMLAEVAEGEAEILPVPAPSAASLIAAVKQEARNRILAVYPDWKQANMTARGVELVRTLIVNGQWTAAEATEAAALDAAWARVKTIRAQSDALEAEIAAMNDAERSAFSVTNETHW